MAFSWKELGHTIASAAPLLGGALGGPGGAAIGELVASALGVENTPGAISNAMNTDPQAMVKLREIQARNQERLEELALDRHRAELEAETARHAASQETIRTEAEHGTDYVKETRPRIARISGYSTVLYCLVAETARLITEAWGGSLGGADVAVAAVLFSPCGTYMTMRTFDGFSKKGKS